MSASSHDVAQPTTGSVTRAPLGTPEDPKGGSQAVACVVRHLLLPGKRPLVVGDTSVDAMAPPSLEIEGLARVDVRAAVAPQSPGMLQTDDEFLAAASASPPPPARNCSISMTLTRPCRSWRRSTGEPQGRWLGDGHQFAEL